MELTSGAKIIIKTLNESGYGAYAVGGFVRNSLLGLDVSDIDITTSATPSEMLECFKKFKTYPTGLKHGTVTVNVFGENIEVTTYRIDGEYQDNRHPKSVSFVRDLALDLERRDFTVNAMAYSNGEIVDLFGGQADLKAKIIKCVGNPDERFKEDALRILRALRFASVLGFEIDKETADAAIRNKELLKNVSKERVFQELNKLLLGVGVKDVLLKHREIIFEVIPELKKCDGFEQNSKFHSYDVYTHIANSVANGDRDLTVRWALLLHDIEKPSCYTEDNNGVGHFYGHQKKSAEVAERILKRLKAPNKLISDCYRLIKMHDCKTEITRAEIKKLLSIYGYETLMKLAKVKIGDALAHAEPYGEIRVQGVKEFSKVLKDVIDSKEPYRLKDLKVTGDDVKALGYRGAEIKEKLALLLDEVIKGNINNDKNELINRLK